MLIAEIFKQTGFKIVDTLAWKKKSCVPLTGKNSVIFISNKKKEKVDQAVRTRCMVVDVSMTPEEKIERMRTVLKYVSPEIPLEVKEDSLDPLKSGFILTLTLTSSFIFTKALLFQVSLNLKRCPSKDGSVIENPCSSHSVNDS
jgi:hypothetical protein